VELLISAEIPFFPAKPKAIRSESIMRIACPSGEDACAMAAASCGVDGPFANEFREELAT